MFFLVLYLGSFLRIWYTQLTKTFVTFCGTQSFITIFTIFLLLPVTVQPISSHGLPCFHSPVTLCLSAACQLLVLCSLVASFPLHVPSCSSVNYQTFFLRYFFPKFILGFCYRLSLLHAQPTLIFTMHVAHKEFIQDFGREFSWKVVTWQSKETE